MNIKSVFIIFSLACLLTSFTKSENLKESATIQSTDSIPEMNRRIIDYVNTKLKKKVGTGECWDFAAEALQSVNAKWDMKYKFGKDINYKKEPVFPGDIIQFENVVLNYEIKGVKYKEKMSHHTAIIFEVKDKTNFTIAHQNNGYSGRKVGVSPLDIATLTKGKFTIYRPEK